MEAGGPQGFPEDGLWGGEESQGDTESFGLKLEGESPRLTQELARRTGAGQGQGVAWTWQVDAR